MARDDERLHRPPPQRPGPRRAVIPEAEGVNGRPVDSGGQGSAGDDVASRAVNAAYRVVEDNIQEGRRAAERLRGAGPAPADASPGARAIAGRLMHLTRDLGGTWVDLILAVLKEPEVRAVIDRLTLHDRGPVASMSSPVAPAPSPATSITQRVSSRKPVEVTLSPLPALARSAAPAVAGLHALSPASPPIDRVALTRRPDGGLELAITIADDQPADTYWGALVDVDSRQPIGTLTVRILE
jgi:hypothetical protein